MCGACGRTVVPDPLLGTERTLRQHLIVAQTVNEICRSWSGAPKVVANSGGWLVSRPTGGTEAVSTVEALWNSVLRGNPAQWPRDLRHPWTFLPGTGASDLPWHVLALGRRLSHELATGSATGNPGRKLACSLNSGAVGPPPSDGATSSCS